MSSEFLNVKDIVKVCSPSSAFDEMRGVITKIYVTSRPVHYEVTFPPQYNKNGDFVYEEYSTTFLGFELEKAHDLSIH